MTKLYSFRHFADSISIFDLVKRHYPFKKYITDFNSRFAGNIEESFLNAEIKRIRSTYKFNDGPGWFGYHHRIERRDHPVSILQADFIIWRSNWERTIMLPFEIKKEAVTEDKMTELLEKQFFEFLAKGVNDAQLEEYILKIKSGDLKEYPGLPVKQIEISSTEIKPGAGGGLNSIAAGENQHKIIFLLLKEMDVVSENGVYRGTGIKNDETITRLRACIAAMFESKNKLFKNPKISRQGIMDGIGQDFELQLKYAKKGNNFDQHKKTASGMLSKIVRQKSALST